MNGMTRVAPPAVSTQRPAETQTAATTQTAEMIPTAVRTSDAVMTRAAVMAQRSGDRPGGVPAGRGRSGGQR